VSHVPDDEVDLAFEIGADLWPSCLHEMRDVVVIFPVLGDFRMHVAGDAIGERTRASVRAARTEDPFKRSKLSANGA
jgi:hypothetical protein